MSGTPSVTSTALRAFEDLYSRTPTHVARAPGRVNLIGEHVDYHHLPVMPFAIDRAVYVVFAAAEAGVDARRVRIASGGGVPASGPVTAGGTATMFEPDAFELDADIPQLPAGDWRNYVRAAARSLVGEQGVTRGIDAWVASDLPVAAGLSSSSALVVAVGLALGRANELLVGRRAFAEQMARAERFTGTEGGGMDQAASLLSREAHLSLLGFAPLSIEHIPFPEDLCVLLANSGEVAEKSGTVQGEYNERRETGERALERVARAAGVVGAAGASGAAGMEGVSFEELLTALPPAELLALAEDHLDAVEMSRFRHVVTEWLRVRSARRALESGDFEGLGRLLFESHASLRDDYGVSTPALDRLVEVARDAGALGARLTGAGFGGSAVVLATAETEASVRSALVAATGSETSVLSVRPAGGAEVMEL